MKKRPEKTYSVAVVATMSAGKSTLLNAMIGHRLLPARNEACTASVCRIEDCDELPAFRGRTKVAGGVVGGVEDTAGAIVTQSNGPVAHQVAYDVAYQNVPSNTAGRIFLILKDGPLGRPDIAKAIGVTRMARSLKMALDTLLEDGLIEYTIPEKPRSRLQKYRLTEKGRQMLAQKGTHK